MRRWQSWWSAALLGAGLVSCGTADDSTSGASTDSGPGGSASNPASGNSDASAGGPSRASTGGQGGSSTGGSGDAGGTSSGGGGGSGGSSSSAGGSGVGGDGGSATGDSRGPILGDSGGADSAAGADAGDGSGAFVSSGGPLHFGPNVRVNDDTGSAPQEEVTLASSKGVLVADGRGHRGRAGVLGEDLVDSCLNGGAESAWTDAARVRGPGLRTKMHAWPAVRRFIARELPGVRSRGRGRARFR